MHGGEIIAGDLLAIPLSEGVAAAGIVLHVSRVFRKNMLLGVYDQIFRSAESIDPNALEGRLFDVPNYVDTLPVLQGVWPVVGNSPGLLRAPVPELRMGAQIYLKDEVVGTASREELKRYPALQFAGYAFVENRLRKHFGIASDPAREPVGERSRRGSGEEQGVEVHVRLSDDRLGSDEDLERARELEDTLAEAAEERGAGQHTAVETGEGYSIHYMEGPDADTLLDAIRPVLERFGLPQGSYAVERYGGGREERTDLS